jgi:hypothetical protein
MNTANIDGEVVEVEVKDFGYQMITSGSREWYIFQNEEEAGKEAREYYKDMAENDAEEFICMVGEETLVKWCLGEYAGPGLTQVTSLEAWLDLWLDNPEEQWAGYDGITLEGTISNDLKEELGFDSNKVIFYRSN